MVMLMALIVTMIVTMMLTTMTTIMTKIMTTMMMIMMMKTSGMPSPYSPSSILILVSKEGLSMLLFGSTWMMMMMMMIMMMIDGSCDYNHSCDNLDYDHNGDRVEDKTLGESGRGRVGELECGGEEGRGTLL